jgi:phenylacetate-coenzyme A ligase PaaK-like adenylate-forming protein
MGTLNKKIHNFLHRFRPLPDYYGDEFKAVYAFLIESQHWSREKIGEYKLGRLKALVRHAEQKVPYYRDLFKKHGIKSDDIRTFEDFSKIPILTKDDLRNNLDQLKADNFESYNPTKTKTSGTSGSITTLYRGKQLETFRRAVLWRFYNLHGFKFRDRRVTITNPTNFNQNSPVAELDRLENNLVINTYHIVAGQCRGVFNEIRKFKPQLIWGHPNLIYTLSEYARDHSLSPLEAPLIATYGEKIQPECRKLMNEYFVGKYIEYYGNRENSIAAWGNSDGIFYEASEYCHLEIENKIEINGNPEAGELISTSLHNYAVPLIRYNSDDIAVMPDTRHSGSPYPIVKLIGGRDKELLLTRQGLTAPFISVYLDNMKFDKLKRFQITQTALDEIILKIVPNDIYNKDNDESTLRKYVDDSLANNFHVTIEYSDQIDFTEAGKQPAVISKLADDHLVNQK